MKKYFNVIIAGSRNFNDFYFLQNKCDFLLKNKIKEGYSIRIISGTARGADSLGEKYAYIRKYELIRKPANWNDLSDVNCIIKYNKYGEPYNALAGSNRNNEMADIADACIIFNVNKSSGSLDMANICRKRKIPLREYHF